MGEVGTLAWINALLESLWPKVNIALASHVHDTLTPRLQNALPSPFKRAHFARFCLGESTPEFGHIEVTRHSESHVQIELDVRYCTAADILLDLGTAGISFGISQVLLSGRLCVALKPLMSTMPVVGAVHVFFANQPKVDLKFAGIAQSIAEVPGLARRVQETVDDLIRSTLVLPNFKSIQLAKDERIDDLMAARSQQPIGVLRVQVLRGHNLAGTNWHEGNVERFTSDPYCVLKLGSVSCKTSTKRGSSSPEWSAQEGTVHFAVYHPDQELEIDVMDEDRGVVMRTKFIDLLGRVPAVSVRRLFCSDQSDSSGGGEKLCRRVALDTSMINKAMLNINDPVHKGVSSELEFAVEWLDLKAPSPSTTSLISAAPQAMATIQFHIGGGFSEDAVAKGLRWRCFWEDAVEPPMFSQKGVLRLPRPNYEHLPLSLRLNPGLMAAMDKLLRRGMPATDVADVVGQSVDVITQYVKATAEHEQELMRQKQAEHKDVEWHQSLPIFFSQSACARLHIELVEGDSAVVGRLDPIDLDDRLDMDHAQAPSPFKLRPPQGNGHHGGGKLTGWLFPTCGKAAHVDDDRPCASAHIKLSLRVHRLLKGTGPPICSGAGRKLGCCKESMLDSTSLVCDREPSTDPRAGNEQQTSQSVCAEDASSHAKGNKVRAASHSGNVSARSSAVGHCNKGGEDASHMPKFTMRTAIVSHAGEDADTSHMPNFTGRTAIVSNASEDATSCSSAARAGA